MMGRVDVVGGDEEPAQILGDLCQMLNRFPAANLLTQVREGESPGSSLSEKFGMQAFQTDVFHDGAGDTDSVQRLDTGRTVCEDTDGAGGSDGCNGGIASLKPLGMKTASLVCRKDASFIREPVGCLVGVGLDESHQSICNL